MIVEMEAYRQRSEKDYLKDSFTLRNSHLSQITSTFFARNISTVAGQIIRSVRVKL